MAIRRDDLRKTDFSDVSSGKMLAPVHPGDRLMKDFIEPLGISRYRVAFWINLQQNRRRRMAVLIKTYMPSPAVTREIGKFVIAFGHLENLLRLTIRSLLRISIAMIRYSKRRSARG